MPEENQRLRLYKKIAGANSDAALADVRAELEDRYGPLPEHTEHLLRASRVRMICERIGVSQMDRKRDLLHLKFTETATVDPGRLMKLVARNARKGAQFTPQGVLKFPLTAGDPITVLTEAVTLLEAIQVDPVPAQVA